MNKYKFLLIIALMWPLHAAFSMQLMVSPFKIDKPEKGQEKEGIVLHWIPAKPADTYKVFRNGTLIKTLEAKYSTSAMKSVLGVEYETAKKTWSRKKDKDEKRIALTDEEFLEKLKGLDQMFLLASFFNARFAEAYGLRTIDTDPQGSQSYQVQSYLNGQLQESKQSATVAKNHYPKIPTPTGLQVESTHKALLVKFDPVYDPSIIGYNVYYSREENGKYKKANKKTIVFLNSKDATNNQVKFRIEKLKNKKEYFVKVESIHYSFMKSKQSEPKSVRPADDRLGAPPNISKIEQEGKSLLATIYWQAPQVNYAYLNIYRATKIQGPYKRINPLAVPLKTSKFTDPNLLKLGETYWYRLTGVTAKGDETATSVASFIRLENKVKPAKVAIKSIKVGRGTLTIEIVPLANKEKILKHYRVLRKIGNAKKFTEAGTIAIGKKQFVDRELSGLYFYCYQVSAVDGYGNVSDPLKPICAKPKNAFAVVSPKNLRAVYDQGGIVLQWQAPPAPMLKGFLIYRKDSKSKKGFTLLETGVLAKNQRLYIDKNIKKGVRYTYYMVSVAEGTLFSKKSPGVSPAEKKATAPQGVQNLVVYEKGKSYHLSWNHYGNYDQFKVKVINVLTNKTQIVGKTKSKNFIWKSPKPGRYRIGVIAVKQKLDSSIKEYRRVEIK